MESFSTRDVARLLGLSETQVRSQARAGFLSPERGPRNHYRFSFQDLILLRTARQLAQARVPPQRIRRALLRLARQLPAGRSLTEMRITADGRGVLVQDDGSAWNPESGQLQIDFALGALTPKSALTGRRISPLPSEQPTAEQLFELGLQLESLDPSEAYAAYVRALARDPGLLEAHVNAGRLLQLAGRVPEAMWHYRSALRAETPDPTAAFNLGTALEEQGCWDQALAAYQQAVRMDQRFADAHFNLARLYDQLGRRTEAIRHLKVYKRLV